jgi:predicted ATPase
MLTRLKVNGFKNLMGVDVRFGPFTCIAGANGVGKSNLFDAIRFLAALADTTLLEAALSVRAEEQRASDVRGLFHRSGDDYADRMSFETEMIVPHTAVDDFGQVGEAKTTILCYKLELGYRDLKTQPGSLSGELEILSESLVHLQKGEVRKHLLFDHGRAWRDSAIVGACRSPLISTESQEHGRVIKLHQDGRHGRASQHAAETLPRTILTSGSASESPTVLCARREMSCWRLLQLEPAALRKPSELRAPTQIGTDGSHLAAALYHLAETSQVSEAKMDAGAIYCQVANRLSELIGGVDSILVDRDDRRELLTVVLREIGGTELPARALSDGTLRFLALSALELDHRGRGLICMEEPENGIHPERIPAIIRLLQDIAVDVDEPIGEDNPFRQVIVNTHSPAVVVEIPEDCLLVAMTEDVEEKGKRSARARFACLPDTWRASAPEGPPIVPKGRLLAYLNPAAASSCTSAASVEGTGKRKRRKVAQRDDLQPLLPFGSER